MTLVVARQFDEEIRILCDAKVTSLHEIRRGPLTGVLKAVILHRNLCVCFAGNVAVAQKAIFLLGVKPACKFDVKEIIDRLFSEHCTSNCGADFIIASLSPKPSLYRISAGEIERNIKSAWIGDIEAFSDYQRRYHSSTLPKLDKYEEDKRERLELISRMGEAMGNLIQEEMHDSTGDFMVTVSSTNEGFIYKCNVMAFPIRQTIPSGVLTNINLGTAAEGGYAYSVLTPNKPGIGAIGIHFIQGRLGALFYPATSQKAVVYRDVSYEEFQSKVLKEYGFKISGIKISYKGK